MIYNLTAVVLLFLNFSLSTNNTIKPTVLASNTVAKSKMLLEAEYVFNHLNANQLSLPDFNTFTHAMSGFYELKESGLIQKNILTLVDFSLSSNSKRLWVIDLDTNTVLYNSLVAHGRNSGDEFANSFSNSGDSFKSSLGFYATGEIYFGKHGNSLRLDGLEKGLNDKARSRGVVMHGADYVAENFIKNNQRLGRSLGCPALPIELTDEIINLIKNKSCLYIYHPSLVHAINPKLIS